MKSITSNDNPIYKSLKELTSAKGRREQGLFIAEGPHLAQEAINSGRSIRYIAIREDCADKFDELTQAGTKAGAELLVLSQKLFKSIIDTETSQGVLVVADAPTSTFATADLVNTHLAVVLEHVQDPGNLGTILRTALAVNAGFAVLAGACADPWSQKVVRSSQGAVFHLPIIEAENSVEAIHFLNDNGWHTACGHLSGTDFFSRAAHEHTVLVIGNEAAGVSNEAAAVCSGLYKLPMPGRVESLNAAVAAGVMLYDLWREQNT
jgi:RNA methyltransferase, TrmH family